MSLYTVEQVELVRRLRLTGITAQQIVDAFDTLDRLEREMRPFQMDGMMGRNAQQCRSDQTPPATMDPNVANFLASPITAVLNHIQQHGRPASENGPITASPVSQNGSPTSSGHTSRRKRSMSISNSHQFPILRRSDEISNDTDSNRNEEKIAPVAAEEVWYSNGGQHADLDDSLELNQSMDLDASYQPQQNRSMPLVHVLGSDQVQSQGQPTVPPLKLTKRRRTSEGGGSRRRRGSSRPPPVHASIPDDEYMQSVGEDQLDEFMRKGEVENLHEIKEFVATHQFRQQRIATMTGVSQPYVSRFLSGNGRDLSARVRRIMYRWYLAMKNNPDINLTNEVTTNDDVGPPTMVTVNNNSIFPQLNHAPPHPFVNSIFPSNDVVMNMHSSGPEKEIAPRRDRFIFKPAHVRILNQFFNFDPYPNIKKREEIAAACNKAFESVDPNGGRELVTAQVVGNWFSNRRKEKKRLGEMKLRLTGGGGRSGFIRRMDHNKATGSMINGTPKIIVHNVASMIQNAMSKPMQDSNSPPRRPDLANIVNELHAINSNGLARIKTHGMNEYPNVIIERQQ